MQFAGGIYHTFRDIFQRDWGTHGFNGLGNALAGRTGRAVYLGPIFPDGWRAWGTSKVPAPGARLKVNNTRAKIL